MCSGIDQLKFHLDNSQPVTISSENDMAEWCSAVSFVARLVAYIAITAVVMLVILMILKFLNDINDESPPTEQDVRTTTSVSEINPLWSNKAMPLTYGTCDREDEGDLETGSCSSGEDLYDGRICVICYDEQRNCFFVPCGHCATCYDCAQRIYEGENRVCPVCRRVIGKVRKLFAP